MANAAAEVTRRSRAVTRQYSPTCRALSRYVGGEDALSAAHAAHGEFVLVFQVRPLEYIPYWLGIPFRPHHAPLVLVHDPVGGHYIGLPASLVPGLTDGVLRGVTPFTRILGSTTMLDRVLQGMAERLSEAVPSAVRAAERMTDRVRERVRAWRVA